MQLAAISKIKTCKNQSKALSVVKQKSTESSRLYLKEKAMTHALKQ